MDERETKEEKYGEKNEKMRKYGRMKRENWMYERKEQIKKIKEMDKRKVETKKNMEREMRGNEIIMEEKLEKWMYDKVTNKKENYRNGHEKERN